MFGLFNRFGRSRELRCLDDALRAAGLHPALVPEAVKLTTVRQLGEVTPETCIRAAVLLGYCMLGPEDFAEACGAEPATAAERRLEAAVAAGDSLDARLVLLALHSGLVAPVVVERHGLEAG